MKTYSFLFWAYNVIWASLAAYLLLVARRTKSVDTRIAALEKRLQRPRD